MMNSRITIPLLLVFLYCPISAWSQWSQHSIPPSGFQGASGPCVDSSHNFYVGASGAEQFYKLDFSTNRWSAIRVDSAHPTDPITASMCLANGTVVAAGRSIFLSSDGGAHWTKERSSPGSVNCLSFSPYGALLAATGNGVYLRRENDSVWTKAKGGLPTEVFYSVYAASNGYYFATTLRNMYWSTDSGKTWTQPDSTFTASDAYAGTFVATYLVNNQGTLLAGGYSGVFQSTNNGQNWTTINAGYFTTVTITSLCKSSNGSLYATTYWRGVEDPDPIILPRAGSWRSTDDGATWKTMPGLWGYRGVAILNVTNNLLVGTTDEGVFESSDYGDHWFAVDSGFSTGPIQSIEYYSGSIYTSLGSMSVSALFGTPLGLPDRGIERSSDNGSTWHLLDDSLIDDNYELSSAGGRLYAKGTATIYQWDGNVWHPLPQFADQTMMTSFCVNSRGDLFASSPYSGVSSLPSGGDTWAAALGLLGLPADLVVCDSGNVLYSLIQDSIYVSSDNGISWSLTPFPSDSTTIYTMAANIDTLCVATSSSLYRSHDHGATWTAQPFGKKINPIGLAFHGGMTFVYNNSKIWETESDTSAWQMDTGYTGASPTSMIIGDNNIAYLGTAASGIYSRSLPPTGSSKVASPITAFDIPPFEIFETPSHLTVRSDQPSISLRLFNILGDERVFRRGMGTLEVDLSSLSAGTYFAVIETSNAREVRRIAIVH